MSNYAKVFVSFVPDFCGVKADIVFTFSVVYMFEGVGQCLQSSAWCYSVWRIVFCHFCLVYNEHLIRCGYCTVYCTISNGRRVYVCARMHAHIHAHTHMHKYVLTCIHNTYRVHAVSHEIFFLYYCFTFYTSYWWCTGNYFWKSYLEIIIINMAHLLEYYLPLSVKS